MNRKRGHSITWRIMKEDSLQCYCTFLVQNYGKIPIKMFHHWRKISVWKLKNKTLSQDFRPMGVKDKQSENCSLKLVIHVIQANLVQGTKIFLESRGFKIYSPCCPNTSCRWSWSTRQMHLQEFCLASGVDGLTDEARGISRKVEK